MLMTLEMEKNIDSVLMFMTNILEEHGATLDTYEFEFDPGQPEHEKFMQRSQLDSKVIEETLKACFARKLIEFKYIGHAGFSSVWLTEEGQGRGLSAKLGKNRSYELGATMHITNLNIQGQAQVGSGNVQNINNFLTQLHQQIENADAPTTQKEEAKNLLSKFIEHPLVSAILGGVAGGITGNMK
jgi:hypothetical protein